MNSIRVIAFCLIYVGCLIVEASASSLVQFPTGPAAWTVAITPSPSANPKLAAVSHLVKIEVRQDDQKRCSVLTGSNKSTYEQWNLIKQNAVMSETPDGSIAIGRGNGAFNIYLLPFTASDFQWVSSQVLVEKDPVSYQGKMCFHYRSAKREAWIEEKTHLPVALDDGTNSGVFTFQLTNVPPLAFSPKFQAALYRLQPAQ